MTGDRVGGIAIIGIGCRFPGAATPSEFWSLLRDGRETIRRFTPAELHAAGVAQSAIGDPRYVPARGVVEHADLFDAQFFGLTGREASLLDPQHRLWLECAWEAMEDGGYRGAGSSRSVGVFAACRLSSYLLHQLCGGRRDAERLALADDPEAYQILLGNDKDLLAGRTSYLLDLRGPSMAVQTACSSSLVAVAQACQCLLAWQADLCLAGGACVEVPTVRGYRYQEHGIRSPDGHCRAFDARAQGTVFSDGVGVVLLKRLEDALADRDPIYAVIRGFAVTNDGAAKLSIAAPGMDGQAEAVALAQAVAGIEPRSVTYIEAHGTGTGLGDPVEVAALTKAFRIGTSERGFCGLGSVKTNIGHADAAAGVAGLIKTALALAHREIPPSLHFDTPHPALELDESPFYVVRRLTPWHDGHMPRRAGVTSLGVGGTNCHLVLEEAPASQAPAVAVERPMHLLTLSARSWSELRDLGARYAAHLRSGPDESLADVCYTASVGRAHFAHRLALRATHPRAMADRLDAAAREEREGPAGTHEKLRVGFLFTGQGAVYSGMARVLYETQPVFRAALDRCAALLGSELEQPLVTAMHDPAAGALLERADYGQPALYAIQIALAELWRSWGITPDVVLGHSLGELAAATVAGVLSPEDGLRLVSERGRLMHALPERGAMVTAMCDEAAAQEALAAAGRTDVTVAVVNAPGSVVLSGTVAGVETVADVLSTRGVATRRLPVSHAFHSGLMDPVLEPIYEAAGRLQLTAPRVAFVSGMTGTPAGGEVATPAYWREQIRRPVRFADGFAALEREGPLWLIEIGPQPVLLGLGRQCTRGSVRGWIPSLKRDRYDWDTLLEGLGRLYEAGAAVDWIGFDAPYARRRVHLPTYPFRRKRHWIEPALSADGTDAGLDHNPLLGRRIELPLSSEIRFEARLSAAAVPHLSHHRLFGRMVLAASSHLALILSAAEAAFGRRACVLEGLTFQRPVVIPDEETRVVHLVLAPMPDESGLWNVQLASRPAGGDGEAPWTLHVSGRLRVAESPRGDPVDPRVLVPSNVPGLDGAEFYEKLWGPGSDTGPAFRWIERIVRTGSGAAAGAAPSWTGEPADRYPLAPGLIEACFQTLFHAGAFETRALAAGGTVYVPFTIERLVFHGRSPGTTYWCLGRPDEEYAEDAPAKRGDMRLLDQAGNPIAEITGFVVRRLRRETLPGARASDSPLHRVVWAPVSHADGPVGVAPTSFVHVAADDPTEDAVTLLARLRDLAERPGRARLVVVTRGALRVRPDDLVPGARHAALWGMARVAARELPVLDVVCVDLEAGADLASAAALLDTHLPESAVREGTRWVPRLTSYAGPSEAALPMMRSDASYVVTDACSAQGLAVCDWLVRHGARHLVLAAGPAVVNADALTDLERRAQVRLVATDPMDPAGSAERVREAWDAMPPVAGVLHLDVPMPDGVIALLSAEDMRAALRGAELGWALHEATRRFALDFFVCFTTGTGLLGMPGQCAYAAAGASLDALAHHRRALGLPGVSIAWGPWETAGKAAVLPAPLRRRLGEEGWQPLATADALRILGNLLTGPEAQVAVLPLDWATLQAAPSRVRRSGPSSESVLESVRRLVAQVVGADPADLRDDLSLVELGVDSLGALLVANRIQQELGREVTMADVMAAPDIAAVAAAVERRALAGVAGRAAS